EAGWGGAPPPARPRLRAGALARPAGGAGAVRGGHGWAAAHPGLGHRAGDPDAGVDLVPALRLHGEDRRGGGLARAVGGQRHRGRRIPPAPAARGVGVRGRDDGVAGLRDAVRAVRPLVPARPRGLHYAGVRPPRRLQRATRVGCRTQRGAAPVLGVVAGDPPAARRAGGLAGGHRRIRPLRRAGDRGRERAAAGRGETPPAGGHRQRHGGRQPRAVPGGGGRRHAQAHPAPSAGGDAAL
ncbi:MAG: hypothetical protein AVDCRST_MAG68-1398, partial [uncultured Gemmatimonadetes bacterium]